MRLKELILIDIASILRFTGMAYGVASKVLSDTSWLVSRSKGMSYNIFLASVDNMIKG